MDLLAAILLGAVQGVTEFLPVSSSAHLILARSFFGWDTERFGLPFDVACHVGTLVAVLIYFRADIAGMIRASPLVFHRDAGPDGRRVRLIVIGTVPIVIVGLTLAGVIESSLRTPVVAATALLVGAGILLVIERLRPIGKDEASLGVGGALIIGMAQALALIPGVSRSGSTIAAGMALGLRRDAAARFAFLLSIPAVTAAAVEEGLGLRSAAFDQTDAMLFLAGMVTSAVVGYVTVKYFIRFLATRRLDVFAWYRVALALATYAWIAGGRP